MPDTRDGGADGRVLLAVRVGPGSLLRPVRHASVAMDLGAVGGQAAVLLLFTCGPSSGILTTWTTLYEMLILRNTRYILVYLGMSISYLVYTELC